MVAYPLPPTPALVVATAPGFAAVICVTAVAVAVVGELLFLRLLLLNMLLLLLRRLLLLLSLLLFLRLLPLCLGDPAGGQKEATQLLTCLQ